MSDSVLKSPLRIFFHVLSNIFVVLCAGLCIFLVYMNVRYDARYVRTGSMLPDYQIGALVWIDENAYKDAAPAVGDVAVYKAPYADMEIIHRIIAKDPDGNYVFKGDNNDSPDGYEVTPSMIIGKEVTHINFLAPLVRVLNHISSAGSQ